MSPSTSTNDRGVLPTAALPAPLKAGAFWLAVALPFLTLVVLTNGLETTLDYATLLALLTTNVLALVVGHDYGQ